MMFPVDIWAILGGLAVGFGASLALGLVLGILSMFAVVREHGGGDDMEVFDEALEAETRALFAQPMMQLGMAVFSLVAMLLAGFLTARWAQGAPMQNAALMAALTMVLGLMMGREAHTEMPRWLIWFGYLVTVPAALAGAWLHQLSVGG